MSEAVPKRTILGVQVSVIDPSGLLERIDAWACGGAAALVNNVNIHACNLAWEQPAFRDVLNRSEIVFCDGYGVKLGGWLAGLRLGRRMTPPDWIDALFGLCAEKGYRIYFLGDTDEVVRRFAETVQARYPALCIAGCHHGFFDPEGPENDRVVESIAQSGADIVLTAMGMPRQELWAWKAKERIGKGVFIATGALFRWYTGCERRAPQWMAGCGLEWFARLAAKPRTHFRRYVVGIPLFFWRLLLWRFR